MISLYLLNRNKRKTHLTIQIMFIIIRNCKKNLPLIVSVNNNPNRRPITLNGLQIVEVNLEYFCFMSPRNNRESIVPSHSFNTGCKNDV